MKIEQASDQKTGNAKPILKRIGLSLFILWAVYSVIVNKYRMFTYDGLLDDYVPAKYTFSWVLYSIHPTLMWFSGLAGVAFWIVFLIWALRNRAEADDKQGAGDDE